MAVFPEIRWAQRSSASDAEKNFVYLTIEQPNLVNDSLELTATSLKFSGEDGSNKFAVEFEFFAEIDVENSKKQKNDRNVFLVLRKKELNEEYWPRLTKDKVKRPYIKTDFDKWVDEDEQNEQPVEDFGDMAGMGGMPGMPDMGAMGGMPGMGGAGAGAGDGGFDMSQLLAGMGGGGDGGFDMSKLAELQKQFGLGGEGQGNDETISSTLGEADEAEAEDNDDSKVQEVN
ncbi:Protein wos2 [Wickerhamiella sorbophila]|uniref:Protein wos2 n=1 Tax=Wickerhamiella sorbophila TaxID=45607 RepID=A0A2T0FGH4_9ASCO|nr:Protein wos2 [Wickerhamiella sorbophila]PRT54091.1 Protein wos2 [Wickerhamiella sorbophila]